MAHRSMRARLNRRWQHLWMRWGGTGRMGRHCCRMAAVFTPGHKSRVCLARVTESCYLSPLSVISHESLVLGRSVFIGDGVTIYGARGAGNIHIMDKTCLHKDTIIETGDSGSVRIGENTHIQPRCHISAYRGSVQIGRDVQIAPACGFYPYGHGTTRGGNMSEQPVTSKGDIVIEDDVWIGHGVVVLENVTVGKGAVIAAGAVVRSDISAGAIAAGVPARVVGWRE
jgi:acetyltransferase-like isoleucine patch superfamily enzyme